MFDLANDVFATHQVLIRTHVTLSCFSILVNRTFLLIALLLTWLSHTPSGTDRGHAAMFWAGCRGKLQISLSRRSALYIHGPIKSRLIVGLLNVQYLKVSTRLIVGILIVIWKNLLFVTIFSRFLKLTSFFSNSHISDRNMREFLDRGTMLLAIVLNLISLPKVIGARKCKYIEFEIIYYTKSAFGLRNIQ